MTRRAIYSGLLALAVALVAVDVSAQRYPERRATRQGTGLYNDGDFEGAEAAYRRALELNPRLREALFNLGGALLRQDRAQEAAGVWTGIATDSLADPKLVSAANYDLGNVALAGEQIDAAIDLYKQSLRLNPDDAEAKYNLAYAQKLKREQEQNDRNGGGGDGGGGQNDQNRDQDGNGDSDPRDGDGQSDSDHIDGQGDGQGGNTPPPTSGQGQGETGIDPRAAEQMLDAMQAAEDDTREKMNAQQAQAGARSGKNW